MAEGSTIARIRPLDGRSAISVEVLAMRPCGAAARWALRLAAGSAASAVRVAGLDLGGAINTWRPGEGAMRALRLGPDEWLLLAPDDRADAIAGELARALAGHVHALVDVSHRYAAIEIAGSAAADVLNAGCPLDLDAGCFPTGSATRTLLAKAEVVLQRLDDRPGYRIETARSLAPYVWEFLAEAARDAIGA